ncbi:hypothetical protein PSN45_003947 [Yamadazyma tenuis]|uniref:CTLH domain-containing protein n=1 Tax=Candida tenuis (strain ATCC 10573 / BCRC 21748 / CBS 615 / JCM 9827 / NBRC 10315 / NRRL Y-1498 / VKM Y-70) TaxID=590646 RepID=G3B4L3_CANTC|nr:uncharacterized protein CANTEDRAFT_114010 [Yamadazyma tenuis ATCC 10573]EGV63975.1 hypothetical protein CANTEDRAFT_114010 [Yamadazyma tenuis ATCC 10573]WEJ96408.1 hypothetical protein PSN45_003947 [Yamadazyma tenuis]
MTSQVSYKSKIDRLILNYFIQEGYKEAAITFSKETNIELSQEIGVSSLDSRSLSLLEALSNTSPDDQQAFFDQIQNHNIDSNIAKYDPEVNRLVFQDRNTKIVRGYSTINERKEIKYLILTGSITTAIEKISEFFPSVLDSNNLLHFKLLRLNLIEMIRSHKLTNPNTSGDMEKKFLGDILGFVRTNLVNKVTRSYKLLKELEITMSLLCFNFDPSLGSVEHQKDLPEELRSLFDLSLRTQCYKLVNRAILNMNKPSTESYNDLDSITEDQARYEQLNASIGSNGYAVKHIAKDDLEAYLDQDSDSNSDLESVDDETDEMGPVSSKTEGNSIQDEALEDEANKLQTLEFESKLERVVKLWALTEHRMVELNTIKEKRYDLNDEFI